MKLMFTLQLRYGVYYSFYEDDLHRKYYTYHGSSDSAPIQPCYIIEWTNNRTLNKDRLAKRFDFLDPIFISTVKVDFLGQLKWISKDS